MTGTIIHHAIGLHLHQPPGNLRLLIEVNPWEAEEIVRCYERVVRYALTYRDVARLHIGFSGVLLEQLIDPDIVDRYRHLVDLPAMLEQYREAENIELIGMGYYHPIFPLIPRADWLEQLERGMAIMERVFGRVPRGFWPPEMAFTMDMIPALVQAGYDYVVVDGVHVRPEDGISDIFRPYVACHDGCCISVVPRDRDVSNAQSSGIDLQWFQDEVRWRIAGSPRPRERRLVTTWSDGENGGWFRQLHEESGFFGHFFAPYMDRCRTADYPIKPICLSHYLAQIRPLTQARIQTGAWNVGSTSGEDLSQWFGSERQRQAVAEVKRLSARYWDLCRGQPDAFRVASEAMFRARRLILEAETSCFLFWSDAWIPHLYARTAAAEMALREVEASLEMGFAMPSEGFDRASSSAAVATLATDAREAQSDLVEPLSGSGP
ncbi:glycoside hydrolase family 57 [Thiocystis minor]|uniref:glycoside hydrolase family 57 n=1 Tax=Thiocystis minor TaxID=61597 RepID=UPI0019137A02|nr:glycoside hydrolase family 57 [Thiocystis minor]MBK5964380.1 glycoside hydrolase family 57 [Thiocystis minor]